ncbi:hypothetical protein ALDI51_12730 [Alicycliphilus denitrificans]|uniref:sigma-70 family RNA polymerase sigma factor n=1 Tax=Alicycliphilus denitrificans TaxID=179636 RepID=UPI00095FC8F7|nr:sigma-70 family RNA polymerase sigma factor [Alicycliphilus denitrificans]MBN9575478.1 sigma-70 family RNA polymerase sigma factor [Alicycliphilus denitrificans]OJW83426.1 MAG: hypothetical protein BGO66_07135 [Alicycliphilus sp. 69-12]BCN37954.1 hypothetical protein ALDI51_12730 [Alicycliphilus denitrificans]
MTAQAAASSPLLASFRDSYRDLVRYLARRTGCADEARDVAHDTWLRLADMDLRGAPPVQCEAEARAYVFTMARNLVIDRRRHEGMAQRHAHVLAAPGQGPDETEALMYRQAIAAVEAALATVPERTRQVFLRHRINGEDQGALAAEFGISRNMVERDVMLAMDRVQAAMERWHGSAPTARRGRRRALSALLGVAGLSVSGALAWRWWRTAVPAWQRAAATGHAQMLRQPLPDGGSVTLDAQSRVQLAYYAARRSARLLAGAAFFDVVRDEDRPFVVDVPCEQGAVRITVLGTRFGVERLPGDAVEVQVESGLVRVESLGADGGARTLRELRAGEAMRISAEPDDTPPRVRSGVAAAPWRQGMVAFTDVPLGEAVERLRRYLPRPVLVEPQAALLRLSGQVRIAQAEDFVRALPSVVPVRVQLAAGRWSVAAR